MIIRQQKSNRAGWTLIELLECIAAIALGGWLADKASSHFEGVWHSVVFWTIATVGSGVIFVLFLYGFGYLFSYLRRHEKTPKPAHDSDKPNAA